MAGSENHILEGRLPWECITQGSFTCNGASSPTTTAGSGFTVARTGTGAYTITVPQATQILSASVQAEDAGADLVGVLLNTTAGAGVGLTVTTISGASGGAKSATDLGSPVKVHFTLAYQRTAAV